MLPLHSDPPESGFMRAALTRELDEDHFNALANVSKEIKPPISFERVNHEMSWWLPW
jgi:hypothetical protein